ncbi:MAG: hypothetical protein ACL93V_00215 [Candidatus Electrothrix sp. YB6]
MDNEQPDSASLAFQKEIVEKLRELPEEDMLEVLSASNSVLRMTDTYQNNNNN